MKQTTPTPLKELREIKEKAKARRLTLTGMLKRARNLVWVGWLWFLVWLAEWNWKTWTIFIVLLMLTIIAYILVPVEEAPKYGLDHDFALDSPEFLPSITGATDTPFLPGNKIDIYNNGDEFYPVMLAEIGRASRSITVEAYIYWGGEIGMKFAQAFAARRRAGVTVKLLLDSVGSATIGNEILEVLEEAGCEVKWYRPIHWYTINRINNRTHRKSLIIDGRVGFTGGAGIADHWLGHAQDPDHWRDIQIRIEGPAVTPLQSAFSRNWLETTGELVSGEPFYPQQEAPGTLAVQSILSWPETGSSTVRVMYYLSIVCARQSIFIANPYFVPDDQAMEILINAKRRGVDVKIMVAGVHNDNILARRNSTRLYGPLLEAGVEIYEYQKTMLHHKFMVCDGLWATIGTTNFDARSFAHNDENNVCTYDRDFASRWAKIFQDDLAGCERITLEKWRDRGLLVKAFELLASLLKSQV